MIEIDLTGVNSEVYPYMATWHWHVALYLFLGGLVAGLMIFSSTLRLMNVNRLTRAILIGDWVSLPVLAVGMLLLWVDLANRWNAWRFFTTLKLSSPMSWGSWILLGAMLLLGLRMLTQLPLPTAQLAGQRWLRAGQRIWQFAAQLGQRLLAWTQTLDGLTILFGIGLGLYTGLLLNTIPARPLWDSNLLPFLFLASGLACGWAFLVLFISGSQTRRLAPVSMTLGVVELILILSYVWTLAGGSEATYRAGELFFSEVYGIGLWGLVVLVGLLMPLGIETAEVTRRPMPGLLVRLAPVLTLVGGLSLRFVIVYAGLHSYI